MFPGEAYTKALPNLVRGIEIVGFLSKVQMAAVGEDEQFTKNTSYILYDCKNEIVRGLSKTCYTLFGIPKCLVYGDPDNNMNELKIKDIFGSKFERDDQSSMIGGNQFQVQLNTTQLEN